MRLILVYPEDAETEEKGRTALAAAAEVCATAGEHPYMAWRDHSTVYSGLNIPGRVFSEAEIAGAMVWVDALSAAMVHLKVPEYGSAEIDVVFGPGDEVPPDVPGPDREVLRDYWYRKAPKMARRTG
ncbi:MAG: hypothetical protein V4679_02735 [Pseudomonadota bacterium]